MQTSMWSAADHRRGRIRNGGNLQKVFSFAHTHSFIWLAYACGRTTRLCRQEEGEDADDRLSCLSKPTWEHLILTRLRDR